MMPQPQIGPQTGDDDATTLATLMPQMRPLRPDSGDDVTYCGNDDATTVATIMSQMRPQTVTTMMPPMTPQTLTTMRPQTVAMMP